MRNSSDEPMIYMVVQSKENSVGNYSTEDGTRTFYTELLHWIKEVLSENLDLMKSLLYNDLAEEKAKSLVGLDVTNDWSHSGDRNFSFSNICCNNTSAQFVVLVEIQKRQGDGHQASLPTKYMEGCDSHMAVVDDSFFISPVIICNL